VGKMGVTEGLKGGGAVGVAHPSLIIWPSTHWDRGMALGPSFHSNLCAKTSVHLALESSQKKWQRK